MNFWTDEAAVQTSLEVLAGKADEGIEAFFGYEEEEKEEDEEEAREARAANQFASVEEAGVTEALAQYEEEEDAGQAALGFGRDGYQEALYSKADWWDDEDGMLYIVSHDEDTESIGPDDDILAALHCAYRRRDSRDVDIMLVAKGLGMSYVATGLRRWNPMDGYYHA